MPYRANESAQSSDQGPKLKRITVRRHQDRKAREAGAQKPCEVSAGNDGGQFSAEGGEGFESGLWLGEFYDGEAFAPEDSANQRSEAIVVVHEKNTTGPNNLYDAR